MAKEAKAFDAPPGPWRSVPVRDRPGHVNIVSDTPSGQLDHTFIATALAGSREEKWLLRAGELLAQDDVKTYSSDPPERVWVFASPGGVPTLVINRVPEDGDFFYTGERAFQYRLLPVKPRRKSKHPR